MEIRKNVKQHVQGRTSLVRPELCAIHALNRNQWNFTDFSATYNYQSV